MDLNQKTLVSQKYCTGFVDCRLATILFVLLATGKALGGRGGNTEGRKLILLFTVWWLHLMYKKKSFIVIPDCPSWHCPDCPSWHVLVHYIVNILFHSLAAK